jgi:Protein of unknown function (DUF3072)
LFDDLNLPAVSTQADKPVVALLPARHPLSSDDGNAVFVSKTNGSVDSCKTFSAASRELTGMKTDGTPNPEKPPEQWVTGEEPMTGPQISYLQTLCREADEAFDEKLTKAEASKKIDQLQARTGRGKAP